MAVIFYLFIYFLPFRNLRLAVLSAEADGKHKRTIRVIVIMIIAMIIIMIVLDVGKSSKVFTQLPWRCH